MSLLIRAVAVASAACLAACGGKGSTTPTPTATTTVTISSAGVSPKSVQIAPGARVLFVNSDSRSHNMTSDPHPEHTDCPEINQVGFLTAGQSRETGNFVTAKTCGFHDHDSPDTAALKGSVVIK
jgi:plastocyanin